MSFLLTGQTDSGKSSIAGHLLWKVGYFSNLPEEDKKLYRTHLETLEESTSKSKYSILMDLLDGEVLNNKSKTKEFSIHDFEYNESKFRLIDTPGHQLYIRSLLEGLFETNPETVCLVVSSLENEFEEAWERGTVKEDLLLTRSVGCRHLVVLWNKTDVAVPSKKAETKILNFVKTLRFETIDSIRVSGWRGDGLLEIPKIVGKYRNVEKTPKDVESVLTDTISVSASFFFGLNQLGLNQLGLNQLPLISRGFRMILHHRSGEYEAEIEDFDPKTVIVKNSNPLNVTLSLNKKIPYVPGEKVVLRFRKNTIGFGVFP